MSQPTSATFRQFSKRVAQLAQNALSPIAPADDLLHGKGYFCTTWRIGGRVYRELFVEVPPPAECPERLRVGLYFYDSVTATKLPPNRRQVVRQLLDYRQEFTKLNLALTSSAHAWDESTFSWTKSGIQHWLATAGDKDVVWLWNLKDGLPAPERAAKILRVLAPVWRAWNGLGLRSPAETVDEGARRQVVRELAVRNPALLAAARQRYGTACVVCGFEFERVYGPLGREFIEVHHKKAIAAGRRKTSLSDLTCVCANCHRMLHRGKTILTTSHLKKVVAAQKKARH